MNQESLKGTHQKNIERQIDLEAWGRWKEKGKWMAYLDGGGKEGEWRGVE